MYTLRRAELGPVDLSALSISVALVLAGVVAPTVAPAETAATLSNIPVGLLAVIGTVLAVRKTFDLVRRLVRRPGTPLPYEFVDGTEVLMAGIVAAASAWLYRSVAPARDSLTLTTIFAFGGALALIGPVRRAWHRRSRQ